MKTKSLILLIIALLCGALFVHQRKPVQTQMPTPVATNKAVDPAQKSQPPETATPANPAAAPEAVTHTASTETTEIDKLLSAIPEGAFRESLMQIAGPARHQALTKLLQLNPPKEDYASLRADTKGDLYYVCNLAPEAAQTLPALPADVTAAAAPTTSEAAVPVATPPVRHSRPGSANILYLDFNGHTVTGTAWNNTVTTYNALPYDTDGDITTFSDAEQAVIIQVWERVAEDYAPFDVDVTTEEPATFTSTTGRALITKNTDANGVAMPSSTAGGVAYLSMFGSSFYVNTYSPAFIYYNNLAGGTTASYIAEAVSHELGHNLGLSHDGLTTGATYYGGHGTGETSWGPLMGTGYNRNVSQWCKGEYYLSNNPQDDLAIIASHLPLIPDDAGNTIATATTLPVSSGSFSTTGLFSSATDIDIYAVTLPAGTTNFSVAGYRAASGTYGGNTDIQLDLLDSTGTVLFSNDLLDGTRAALSWTVSAGIYYVRLTPVGTGTPLSTTPLGYTSYGSIGQYTLTGASVTPSTPAFTTQPTSQTVYATTSVSFNVVATGAPTPALQWKFNGTAISGATSTRYTIASTTNGDAGAYTVTATSNQGSATSSTANLTVNPISTPTITTQPVSLTVAAGASATFTAVASGAPAPTYQWKLNGTAIASATNASYTIATTTTASAGSYTLTATNFVGNVTSSAAILTVNIAPAITTQPVSQTVIAGTSVTFSVVATGTPAPTYQWKFNGTAISGATNATYTIAATTSPDAGAYTVTVTNTLGNVTSSAATLTVNPAGLPTITTQPISQTVVTGASATFTVVATGTPTLTYQWKLGGTAITGATNATYTIAAATNADAGAYTVTITNGLGNVTSSTANLTVNALVAPAITTQPVSQTVNAGASASFSVVATGTPTPTYQWKFNGAAISGATNSTYTIAATTPASAGAYTVTVTNSVSNVTSATANLTVNVIIPVITSPNQAGASVNEPFSYDITNNNAPTSFTATGLPTGLVLSSPVGGSLSSAGLTGTPTVSGTFTIALTATNTAGTGTLTLSLIVLPSTTITTLAGSLGVRGSADANGIAATFSNPSCIVADSAGFLYVSDHGNHTIRKIALSGTVTTLAGLAGTSGSADGIGTNARFNGPAGLAIDVDGNLYLADALNSTIRKITPTGVVTTLAGSPGITGTTDGTGTAARFNQPSGMAIDGSGNLYLTDTDNHTIRKMTISGNTVTVGTVAGLAGITGSTDGAGNTALFNTPLDLAFDSSGNLFVADTSNHTIRKIVIGANSVTVSTIAGRPSIAGSSDGVGTTASFTGPAGLAADRNGNLFVSDSTHTLRRITPSTRMVVTLAGRAGTTGAINGAGSNALFFFPTGLTVDANNYVFIADMGNHAIRAVSSAPVITTQPQAATVSTGANVNLTVTAIGLPTPTYQWLKDAIALSGATSATLALTNVQTTQAGSYTVTVSNNMGNVTSTAAILTVTATPPSPSSSSSSSSGGGGGSPSNWFIAALAFLTLIRRFSREK